MVRPLHHAQQQRPEETFLRAQPTGSRLIGAALPLSDSTSGTGRALRVDDETMRALVPLLCLALAAPAPHGANADNGLYCTDPKTNVKIAEGEVLLPADGSCSSELCEGGAMGPHFVTQDCGNLKLIPRINKSCQVEPGDKDAPYPDCCDYISCNGIPVLKRPFSRQ